MVVLSFVFLVGPCEHVNKPPGAMVSVKLGEVLEPGISLSDEGREMRICPCKPRIVVGGSRDPIQG